MFWRSLLIGRKRKGRTVPDKEIRPDEDGQTQRVTFFYENSPVCRAIHASGVMGSVSPDATTYMALFSEHVAYPDRQVYAGKLGQEPPSEVLAERQGRTGVVRQVEAEVFLNEQTAKQLISWLEDRLRNVEEVRKRAQELGGGS